MSTSTVVRVLVLATALTTGGTLAAGEAFAGSAPHHASAASAWAASAARSGSHTIRFTARHTGTVLTSSSSYVLTDTDVRRGAAFGADVLSCKDTSTSSVCSVSFALRGGQLHGSFSLSHADGSLRGRITSGSGRFSHARGTLSGQSVSQSDTQVRAVYR